MQNPECRKQIENQEASPFHSAFCIHDSALDSTMESDMFDTLDTSASGLMAQRTRLDTIAANIANINTTRGTNGELFFAAGRGDDDSKPGVHVQEVSEDPSPFLRKYEPGNPDAGKDGYVEYPNIDQTVEFVNALDASRAYEANVTMMETTKSMLNSALRLLA
jgi:flagellar basal-body rod protein FlgC